MRLLSAVLPVLFVLAAPAGALAACPVPPAGDVARSSAQQADHLLCLQRELSAATCDLAEEARRKAEAQRLDDLIRAQRQQLVRPIVPVPWR